MADTTYTKGRNLLIYMNGKSVGCSKTCTIEVTTGTSDSTTKCDVATNGVLWQNNSPQVNSWKLTDSGVIPINDGSGNNEISAQALIRFQIAQTKVYVQFQDITTGEWFGGNGWITSTKASGSTTEDATYDVTIDGTGSLSSVPVS